jgi:cytochrome c oxidase subunit 4
MAAHGNRAEATSERVHPSPMRYTAIALILAAITTIEVAVVYITFLRSVMVPMLVVLSAIKFTMVAMFFMHLRFDSRIFSTFFVSGLLLAAAMIMVLLLLFRSLF